MTHTERIQRLLPNGVPRYVRCYDNGGTSTDRYTVVYSGNYSGRSGWCQYVTMSADPYWAQGVCLHGESRTIIDRSYHNGGGLFRDGFPPAMGRKHPFLGKRIPFEELPEDCRTVVLEDYQNLWSLNDSTKEAKNEPHRPMSDDSSSAPGPAPGDPGPAGDRPVLP